LFAFLFIALGLWGLVLVLVPIFFVRHEMHQNLQLEQTNRELLVLMVKSIEARDPYTSGHSVRVSSYAKALARALALPAKEVEQIETAALLHDVGKIYEEFAVILRKAGRLSEDERALMRSHPVKSAELVSTISSLRGYVEGCVRAHHENFDGSGYPDGLVGNEIPVGARIIMVADTADAMMTSRPYRDALKFEQVQEELDRYSGTQFDPEVVNAFRLNASIRRQIEQREVAVLLPAEGVAKPKTARWSSQSAMERRPSFPGSTGVEKNRFKAGPA
jgi:putative nucleotidyltransferase with HDIG domain